MSIGSLLLRPGRIRQAASSSPNAFAEDLISLISKIALDRSQGEAVLQIFEQAFAALAQRMSAAMNPQELQLAAEAWLKPFLDGVNAFTQNPPGIDSPADFLEWVTAQIDSVVDFLKALNITTLSAKLAELITLLEDKAGLAQNNLDGLVWSLVDDIIARLEASSGQTAHQCALLLARLKHEAQGSFSISLPSADAIAKIILDQLRSGGLDVFTKQAAKIAGSIKDIIEAGQGLAGVAGVMDFKASTVGPAQAKETNQGDTYCWYASWLLQSRTRPAGYSAFDWIPGCPYDEVWITADGTQVVQRNPFRDDIVLHEGADVKWSDAPLFKQDTSGDHYTFRDGLSPDFLEKWTLYSTFSAEAVKCLWHIIGATEKGNRVVHSLLSAWAASTALSEVIGKKPPMTWLNSYLHGPQWTRWFFEPIIPLTITMLGSMEGMHTKADEDGGNFWMILLAADVLEGMKMDAIPYAARDFFLSLFTGINYQGPFTAPSGRDNRPLNYLHMDGFTTLASTLANWIMLKLIPRERYLYPTKEDLGKDQALTMWLYWNLFGTMVSSITATAMAIVMWLPCARTFSWELLGKLLLKNFLKSFLMFWPSLYSFREGDADDGKYNPRGAAFRGYPGQSSSPYKLPYEKDKAVMCVQGNQGMWSHNNFGDTAQIYAYDFGLDQDELILASRSGTVVDFFDWVPNDSHSTSSTNAPADTGGDYATNETKAQTWNFVLIRHDNPFPDGDENHETNEQRQAHDRGPGGTVLTTYGVYGHGRTGSVRELLMAAGERPKDIIGKHVKHGQPIMKCGNTGHSFHNHLHMDVRFTPAGYSPPANISEGVSLSSMEDITIPFVFRDVTYLIDSGNTCGLIGSTDGVCKSLSFYTSENEKKDA